MKYSLRTLLIAGMVGLPLLALLYLEVFSPLLLRLLCETPRTLRLPRFQQSLKSSAPRQTPPNLR